MLYRYNQYIEVWVKFHAHWFEFYLHEQSVQCTNIENRALPAMLDVHYFHPTRRYCVLSGWGRSDENGTSLDAYLITTHHYSRKHCGAFYNEIYWSAYFGGMQLYFAAKLRSKLSPRGDLLIKAATQLKYPHNVITFWHESVRLFLILFDKRKYSWLSLNDIYQYVRCPIINDNIQWFQWESITHPCPSKNACWSLGMQE